jgi:hypothetical protein
MISLVCALVPVDIGNAGEFALQPSDSNIAKEVSAVARTWADALLKKDFETLTSVSFTDYRSGIRRGLANEQSALYKSLYTKKRSPYQKLKTVRDLGIVALAHKDLARLGSGTTACFFDNLKPKATWPADSALLPIIEKRDDVYCIFLSKTAGRWEVSTDFVERR